MEIKLLTFSITKKLSQNHKTKSLGKYFYIRKKIWSSLTSLVKMSKSNDQTTEKSISRL